MSFSDNPIDPTQPPRRPQEDGVSAQRIRRRRATRRSSIPADAQGQAALIASLARRAYPSVELFVFSLVCGAILGLGLLLDSAAVLLLGILVAPLMTPWVGFLLAVLTGSLRFLFETVMALLISIALVFTGGLLTGFAARIWPDVARGNVHVHSQLWFPALLVLAIGAVTLVISFARSEERPFLSSVIVAYAFFLPVSAGGFGLGSGLPDVWPQSLLVFMTHFALAGLLGLVTLLVLRLRPSLEGIIFSGIALVLFAVILFALMRPGFPFRRDAVIESTPTIQTSAPPSPTFSPPPTTTSSASPSSTSASLTPTEETPSPVPLTLEVTLPPTTTPTVTMTIPPTPVYGRISASEGGGANLRETPGAGGKYLMTLLNGTIVETYSEFNVLNGVTWVKIYATVNGQPIEGWLLESAVAYATPAPNFEASSTPAP
ncbi:MAG: DUF389 domain-containing protein [Anaerolineales bacterium]|nr:MAG: DUF389 domain-containing protein [Anaerolineales bacterium]